MLRLARSAFALLACLLAAPAPAEIGDDGLHKENWFAITFRDVAEDLAQATDEGKRLVLVFEQRGCIYCARMHDEVLSDPGVRDYIRENFMVVQYNLFGDEEVIDLDGTVLTEKQAARRWGVVFTPTIIFLPETAATGASVADAAVVTMPGAFGKLTFGNMFRWVRAKGYEGEEHFQAFHARRLAELRAAGQNPSE
jgi:thioredoxin-related protein